MREFSESGKEYNEKQSQRSFHNNRKNYIFSIEMLQIFKKFDHFKQFSSEICEHLPRYLSSPGFRQKSDQIPDLTFFRRGLDVRYTSSASDDK